MAAIKTGTISHKKAFEFIEQNKEVFFCCCCRKFHTPNSKNCWDCGEPLVKG